MIKKAIVYILMIFTASLATAQSNAQQYIENVIQRIDKAPGISAKFDIGSEHNNGIYMEGTLDMSGKKFRLETNNLTTWYDGKTMWSYAPSIGEVNITQPTAQELAEINPYLLLNNYVKYYNIKEINSKNSKERVFSLTTSKRDIFYKEIILTINTRDVSPTSFQLIDSNNNTTYITISDFDKKVTHPQSTFTFDSKQYPDAAIIDLR